MLGRICPVSCKPSDGANYMEPRAFTAGAETFCSHKTAIKSVNDKCAIVVSNRSGSPEEFEVPMSDIIAVNEPHKFAEDILGNLEFEDGLKCDYESVDTKLKMFQVACSLAPLVAKLDFQAENCQDIQLECIRTIRNCLNIISFDKGKEKIVIAERHKVGNVGKTALFGQGNCHGCSSTMASYLYPFSQLLGIDLKYRGGFSFGRDMDELVKNKPERHQWLEFTCKPSMETFICDLWYEGVHQDSAFITLPIDKAYDEVMYPNGALIIGTKTLKV